MVKVIWVKAMTLLIDIFEPREVELLAAQVVPVSRMSLNTMGYSDYMWIACDGHRVQVERKQVDEMLGDLDGVEEQLRRHLQADCEENYLIYEGTFKPLPGLRNHIQTYHVVRKGNILVPSRQYNYSYSLVMSWFYQLDKAGITVVHTFDYEATAYALASWYKNSQKQEHTTLKRYIKEKMYVKGMNPHVLNLMSVKGGGIGEEKAKALIARFGTFWYTVNQEPEQLAGTLVGDKKLGMDTALKLLRALGRTV